MTEPEHGRSSGWSRLGPLWTVVALLAVAALALWVASLLVWTWTVELAGGASEGTAVVRPQRGAQAQPALVGLAVAGLAAVAAVLATGGWLRRAVGALAVLGGAGALAVAVRGLTGPRVRDAGERWADELDRWSVESAIGVGLAGLAGLLLVAGGVLVLARGHRMPRMGSRYQTPTARRTARAPDRALWDDLDAGRDPTA
jgi:uncharacterized membrane protein (TIGR02234 family)